MELKICSKVACESVYLAELLPGLSRDYGSLIGLPSSLDLSCPVLFRATSVTGHAGHAMCDLNMMVLKCSTSYVAKVVHSECESHFCDSSPSPSSSSSSEVLLELLRSVLSQFSRAVFANVNDKVSNQQFKPWKKQLETHMKTTERILFILFGSLGYSEILSVVLPQLRIQVCCSHYF